MKRNTVGKRIRESGPAPGAWLSLHARAKQQIAIKCRQRIRRACAAARYASIRKGECPSGYRVKFWTDQISPSAVVKKPHATLVERVLVMLMKWP